MPNSDDEVFRLVVNRVQNAVIPNREAPLLSSAERLSGRSKGINFQSTDGSADSLSHFWR
jgi:hypothetical protein